VTVRIILNGGSSRVEVGDLEGMTLFTWKRKSQAPAYLRSTFALSFGRCVARASSWMFKLVDR